ncbi:hypothetical protein [Acrocarpospora catenulata]|uniref:hypothetical protein n=1 Tax=Acrocarpospora catenulata TaxID=2836182 RepID=UPI001BDA8985|nr:hypothetical protein [Acrocarpospora catenulata]
MADLAEFLDDLRCSACGASDALWLFPVRGVVECRECGARASAITEQTGGES